MRGADKKQDSPCGLFLHAPGGLDDLDGLAHGVVVAVGGEGREGVRLSMAELLACLGVLSLFIEEKKMRFEASWMWRCQKRNGRAEFFASSAPRLPQFLLTHPCTIHTAPCPPRARAGARDNSSVASPCSASRRPRRLMWWRRTALLLVERRYGTYILPN